MRRLVFGIALVALTAAFSFGTGTSEAPGAGSSTGPTTVEVWGIGGSVGTALADLAARFNETQDEFEIVHVDKGSYLDTLQAGIAAYRAETHPVVLQVLAEGVSDMLLSGAMYPANELMADAGIDVDWDDYLEPIRRSFGTRDGSLLAFPFNHSTNVMFVNMTKLRSVGIDDPPETWEEVEEALTLLVAGGETRPYAHRPWGWNDLTQFSSVHNIPVATNSNGYDGLDTVLTFNDGLHVRHIEDLKRWYDTGLAQIYNDYFAQVGAFTSGEAAIMITSSAAHSRIVSALETGTAFEFVTTFLPVYEGYTRHNSLAGGGGMFVLSGHSDAEYRGAAAFFDYLRQLEQQTHWATIFGYMPVTVSAFRELEQAGFYEGDATRGREVSVESLIDSPSGDLSRGVRLGSYLQIEAVWSEEVLSVFTGAKTAQQAMDDAVRRGNELLQRYATLHAGKSLP